MKTDDILSIWQFFKIFFLGQSTYNKGTASDKHMRETTPHGESRATAKKKKTATIFWEVM